MMESPPLVCSRNSSAQTLSDKDALVEEFQQVYMETGAHDFKSQVKYLAALADYYHQKGADNSDWVCLLKAHALYNSAAARDEENGEKWSYKAFQVQNTYWGDKVELSYEKQRDITIRVRKRLNEIRDATQTQLDFIKTNYTSFDCNPDQLISDHNQELYSKFVERVESTSSYCTDSMVEIFQLVIGQGVEIAGEPPCQFCAVALGSIARGEATPYSDLEFLFLLSTSTPEIIAYFEFLAVTIYFLIGNLQETKLRYMAIEELDFWFTDEATNGIKIDGLQPWAGNIPTGNGSRKQHNHFICTVDQLGAKYEQIFNNPDPKESLRGDLTAMLSCLIAIYGEVDLLTAFKGRIERIRPNEPRMNASRNMLENDVRKFNFYPHDKSLSKRRNMKMDIYRYPSILLMNLKIIHQLDKSSADATDALINCGALSSSVAAYLRFAFYCALYIRLSSYLYHHSQNENLSVLSADPDLLSSRDQWYMGRPLLIHMMIHLMPLKKYVLDKRLDQHLPISADYIKRSVAIVSYCSGDYQTCYNTLTSLNPGQLGIDVEICSIFIAAADNLGCYEQAEDFAVEQYTYLLQLHNDADHTDVSNSLSVLGYINEHKGLYDRAKTCHTRALQMKQRLHGESDHTAVANCNTNLGNVCYRQGDYENSAIYHTKSLDMRLRIHGEVPHPDIASSYHNVGIVYMGQGSYKEAEMCHTKSLDMCQRIYGNADHPDIAHACTSLGILSDFHGDYKKAEKYHVKALEMGSRMYDNTDHPEIANAYTNLGNVYDRQGEFNKAEIYHSKALKIRKILHGSSNHPDISSSYVNLGSISFSRGDYEKAEQYFTKSLEIDQTLLGDVDHPSLACSYANLGCILQQRGNPKHAATYFTKSLLMRQRLYGSTIHNDIADSYNNLGKAFYSLGDFQKTELYYIKSLEMKRTVHSNKDHLLIANSYSSLGELYCRQALYAKAEEHCLKSLEMMARLNGDSDHPVVAETCLFLAKTYCGQANYDKASKLLNKSLEMAQRLYSDGNCLEMASIFNAYGCLHQLQDLYEKSEVWYFRATEMVKQVLGDCDHPCLAESYSGLGRLYQRQEQYDKAIVNHSKALEIRKRIFGGCDHPDVAETYGGLGDVYSSKGQLEDADRYYIRSAEMKERLAKVTEHGT